MKSHFTNKNRKPSKLEKKCVEVLYKYFGEKYKGMLFMSQFRLMPKAQERPDNELLFEALNVFDDSIIICKVVVNERKVVYIFDEEEFFGEDAEMKLFDF